MSMTVSTGFWARVKARFNGKRFAVLGPRASGKSRFLNWCVGDSSEPEATIGAVRAKVVAIRVDDIRINMTATFHYSGEENAVNAVWKRGVEKADYVAYFLDSRWLAHEIDRDAVRRLREDARVLTDWRIDKPSCIVATHGDLLDGWPASRALLNDRISRTASVRALATALRHKGSPAPLVLGAQNDEENATDLVKLILTLWKGV